MTESSRGLLATWLAVCLSVMLVACGSTPQDEFANIPSDKLYADAKDDAAEGNYEQAIKKLEKVEARASDHGHILTRGALNVHGVPEQQANGQRVNVLAGGFRKQQHATRLEHPEELCHGLFLRHDVVKRLVAVHHVKAGIRQGQPRCIVGVQFHAC